MKTVTSSVAFPDELEGVDTDVIVVLVLSVLLICLVEGNVENVDSLECNDLVWVLFPGTGLLWDTDVEVINGVVVFLYVTEDDCKVVEKGSVSTMVDPAVLSDNDVVTVSENVLVPVTEVLVGTVDDKEVVYEAVDKDEYPDDHNEVDTDECISGVTNIAVLIFVVESVDIADVVVYNVLSLAEALGIELLDTLDEVTLSAECAVARVVVFA